MKHKRLTSILVAFALALGTAWAQSKVEKDMQRLVDDMEGYVTTTIYTSPSGNSSMQRYIFKAPLELKDKLDKTVKNMKAHRKDAYNYQERLNQFGGTYTSLSYGDHNEKSVPIFTYELMDGILLAVRDNKDENKRYAYVLEWTVEREQIIGAMAIVYGFDPQKQEKKPEEKQGPYLYLGKVTMQGNRVISADTTAIVSPDSKDFGEWSQQFRHMVDTVKFSMPESLLQQKKITTDTEFLERFSNLRIALQNSNDEALSASLVNKLMDLCKRRAKLLDSHQLEACIQALCRLKGKHKDLYVVDILEAAILALEGI